MANTDRNFEKHKKLKSSCVGTTSERLNIQLLFRDSSRYSIRARELFNTKPYACVSAR